MTIAAGIQKLWAGVRVHATSVSTAVGVDAGLEPEAVNVGGNVGHIAIFLAGMKAGHCLGFTATLPAASRSPNHHPSSMTTLLVAGFFHAVRGQSFGLFLNDPGIHNVGETIPGIPSHRRSAEARSCGYEKQPRRSHGNNISPGWR